MQLRTFHLAALLAALAVGASGCATAPQAETKAAAAPAAPATPAKPALSAEASAMLTKAEADVKMAKSKFALWSTAQKALENAQAAAKEGDSAKVLKEAAIASRQVQLGIAQLDYPLTNQ